MAKDYLIKLTGGNALVIILLLTIICMGIAYLNVKADTYDLNCTKLAEIGRFNIPQGDRNYLSRLDRNHNGIACEK